MTLTRRQILPLAAAAILLPRVAVAGVQRLSGRAFGSTWHALVPPEIGADDVRRSVDAIVRDIDRLMVALA